MRARGAKVPAAQAASAQFNGLESASPHLLQMSARSTQWMLSLIHADMRTPFTRRGLLLSPVER